MLLDILEPVALSWLPSQGVSQTLQEEDTDYAAEKLQAADELRQWSEAAQCSSIAALVGEHIGNLHY